MSVNNRINKLLIALTVIPTYLYAANPININTATAQELDEALPGIGPSKAEVIVSYRDKHGPFKSLEDVDDVPGIGPKMLERISEFVQFGEAATSESKTPQSSDSVANDNCYLKGAKMKGKCKTN